jgi:hypothetical protein
MTELQCGLCLSCGAPFLPDVSQVEFFNREGVLSVLFLNAEFVRNRNIQTTYSTPNFSSRVEQAHVFHVSHHWDAIRYMCTRHRNDHDVGGGLVIPNTHDVILDQRSAAMLYYHSPSSAANRQARAATWARPPQADRLDMDSLLEFMLTTANLPNTRTPQQDLDQTYACCKGCNALMTQQAGIKYILGYGPAGLRNVNGGVIQGHPIREYVAEQRRNQLPNAYGHWRYAPVPAPANIVAHPDNTQQDTTAPHVAYYLHMCLPFKQPGVPGVFDARIPNRARRQRARTMYIEQCWLILEIAALATLLEEGRVMAAPGTLRSHGMHQHYGVLDFYVSFFLWRLIQFQHGATMRANDLNFVQWHQRFYWDAINCAELFTRNERRLLICQRMYGATTQPAWALVEQICHRLMRHYNRKLRPLVRLIARDNRVPQSIKDFFVGPAVLRELRALARRVLLLFLIVPRALADLSFFLV